MRIARALASWSFVAAIAATAAAPWVEASPSAGVSKGLSFEQIRSVMHANASAFNACLVTARRQNAQLHGPFLYDLEIDKRGIVTSARPFAPSPVASFDRCIIAILKRAKFPGGPASIEAPLVFDAD